jgi:hypothetical protein
MDPIAESHWLYRWQDLDIPADASADPSLRQLRESRAREGLLFHNQSVETQLHLQQQAARIAAALVEGKGEIHFRLPESILWQAARNGEEYTVDVPADFREQRVGGFLHRIPVKDFRSAFRGRLAQLENSGYSGVQASAGLLRFAVVRHIVHDLIPEEPADNLPTVIADPVSPQTAEGFRPDGTMGESKLADSIQDAEAAILRLRRGLNTLHQAISLAPYMYADEEYQWKRNVLLARLLSLGHAVADCHIRDIVRTIRRRADANDLNRGLWLSVPYFDDRLLEMKMHEFEVIPPGRTMFVPAFVALAAAGEQEKIGQENSLSPSTRVHLLAELKSLEQAFDNRPR